MKQTLVKSKTVGEFNLHGLTKWASTDQSGSWQDFRRQDTETRAEMRGEPKRARVDLSCVHLTSLEYDFSSQQPSLAATQLSHI